MVSRLERDADTQPECVRMNIVQLRTKINTPELLVRLDILEQSLDRLRSTRIQEDRLDEERREREDVVDDMRAMARELRANVVASGAVIRGDTELLDAMDSSVEDMREELRKLNARIDEITTRSAMSACRVSVWVLVCTVVFAWMLVLIRMTS